MSAEIANYACPSCSGQLVRDNTKLKRFRCESCDKTVHEAVAENAELLEWLAERDFNSSRIARRLLKTGGTS